MHVSFELEEQKSPTNETPQTPVGVLGRSVEQPSPEYCSGSTLISPTNWGIAHACYSAHTIVLLSRNVQVISACCSVIRCGKETQKGPDVRQQLGASGRQVCSVVFWRGIVAQKRTGSRIA